MEKNLEQKICYIIYHKEDNDGVFSAAIAYHFLHSNFTKYKFTDIKLVPVDYAEIGQDSFVNFYLNTDDVSNTTVVMLDISMQPDKMEQMYKKYGNNFIWCDHHKPIILASHSKKYSFGNCPGYHDRTDQSALIATYKYFNNMVDDGNINELPIMFQYLGVYDSWTHKERGFDFDTINKVNLYTTYRYHLNINDIIDNYNNIVSYNKDAMDNFKDAGNFLYNAKIDDLCTIFDNTAKFTYCINSDDLRLAVMIISPLKYNTAMYKEALFKCSNIEAVGDLKNIIVLSPNNTDAWTMSLYNISDNDDFDCGVYLKNKYKGGGHKGAAGCVLTFAQVKKIFRTEEI